ncbi:unspecified product [Leishmania tarentolae]|uniref:Unspecified product n=1 Tax=Leishmania tarentolae TaxID=5689 RepID=A0A640KY75_LEITA|nr:unspecified product [Leishmania tarentolae]
MRYSHSVSQGSRQAASTFLSPAKADPLLAITRPLTNKAERSERCIASDVGRQVLDSAASE